MESVEQYQLIAVGRTGYTPYVNRMMEVRKDSKLQFIPIDTEDISSTLLRKLLYEGKSVDHLSFNGITNYINNNIENLYVDEESIRKLMSFNFT